MNPVAVGRYEILRELGRGGMGTVYLAYDPELQRHVAIKGLGTGQTTPERRERLRREARAAAALTHPNIAHIYDVITQDQRDFVVMEYVEGKTLAEMLESGPLPPGEVARIGAQVARALAFAHRHGIVHRDVKCENVIITPDGSAKVLDFGLAQIVGLPQEQRLTQEGLVVGTSKAMSPEQATGRAVDARSDIFSLGSLLYEAVVGRPAFVGETVLETMHKVARAEYVPIRQAAPQVPENLALIIERCLERDPQKRFQDASEVASLLASAAQTLGTALYTPLNKGTLLTRQLARRLPYTLGVLVAASLLLALALARGWLAANKPLVVAVLPVSGELPQDAPLLETAIADALAGFLANLEGVHVVAGREVRAVLREGTGVKEAALALGVGEVVETVLLPGPEPGLTRVQLARVDGATGRILWSQALDLASNNPALLQERVFTALADGFRRFSSRRRRSSPPEQALEAYLEVQKRLNAGSASPDYAEELALLEQAERLSPGFSDALLAHASIERYLGANSNDRSRLERAEKLLAQAAAADPDHPQLPLRRAQLEEAKGNPEAAVQILRQLTRQRPGDPAAWAALGSALARLNQKQESEHAFARALSLQPSIITWDRISSARADWGDLQGAKVAAQEILKRAPDHPLGLFRLGYVAALGGEFALCEQLFAKLYPQTNSLLDLNNWGTCAFYKGDLPKALELFTQAREKAPRDHRPHVNLADTYLWLGKREEAQKLYRQALELLEASPHPRTYWGQKARILAHLGRFEEAVLAAQKNLEVNPNRNWDVFVVAEVAALAGDKTTMMAYARKARQLGAPAAWFAGPEFATYRQLPEFQALLGGKS
ncbi:MAG: protein kinase [Thermoanaerobaculum sp.]|nr:protein kinase [Thermoanaerobaculum sp.]MDW7967360.1 protein kinase [Thermoanaerobaculum sp.]